MELLEDEMTLWVWEEKEDTTAATGKCNGLRLIEAYLGLYLPVDSLKFLESPLACNDIRPSQQRSQLK